MARETPPPPVRLKRSLGGLALIIYGVGDILGAGIYVLIGKVVGVAGTASWLAFLIAFVVAALTGFSYAELGGRFPRSAGESVYSLMAFNKRLLSYLVGFLVFLSGLVSMATVSHGFAGYLQVVFPNFPDSLIILCFLLVLATINFWGIRQSSFVNILCTVIEIVGLGIVIVAGMQYFGTVDYLVLGVHEDVLPHVAILQAATLGFYAFIGFEDIVNVAEETKVPGKTIPSAIMISLIITGVFYILTTIAAVSAVSITQLSSSEAPLLLVVNKGFPGLPSELFTLIALFAVTNTALVNFIMSSRILYGMSREGLVPNVLGRIHEATQTPHIAIMAVFIIAAFLALTGGLEILAQSTSFLLLSVFLLMNLSLIVIKWRSKGSNPPFQIPVFIPVLGALSCLGLILFVKLEAFVTVSLLVLFGGVIYMLQKRLLTR
jgi:amino acid transporter